MTFHYQTDRWTDRQTPDKVTPMCRYNVIRRLHKNYTFSEKLLSNQYIVATLLLLKTKVKHKRSGTWKLYISDEDKTGKAILAHAIGTVYVVQCSTFCTLNNLLSATPCFPADFLGWVLKGIAAPSLSFLPLVEALPRSWVFREALTW